jgi:hypothetical protein
LRELAGIKRILGVSKLGSGCQYFLADVLDSTNVMKTIAN